MAVMRALVLLFLVFSVENAAAQDDCYYGWTPFWMKCYQFFSESVDWATAEKNCQFYGANLASVHDIEENNFLLSLIVPHVDRHVWIGGHDGEIKEQWMWTDGSPFYYTNWCPTKPDNNYDKRHCLDINYSPDRCWNDDTCSNKKSYICATPYYMKNQSVSKLL
ncbi:galactose-specific lectin nattectin-like [Paramisgurnus dabryanus]|uniref:galactose-specific lectin nattectin-like n=1 Tax=Paramisgurnus dabryanus TaxID=90735 RepID=UPI0031F33AB0